MSKSDKNFDRFFEISEKLICFTRHLWREFWSLIKQSGPMLLMMSLSGALTASIIYFQFDQNLIKYFKLHRFYPAGLNHIFYLIGVSMAGFIFIPVIQASRRLKMLKRLTQVFMDAGLKSPTGQLPHFISDTEIDCFTRRLRVSRNNFPLRSFQNAKEVLESGLCVYIDEVEENRERGFVDIVYSQKRLLEQFAIENIKKIPSGHFIVGRSRVQTITVKLSDVPHLLIAGQTGSGKSTFLRQLITGLYLNNPQFNFLLIDLKGGLEFQIFKNLYRIKVFSDVERAVLKLNELSTKLIPSRMALFNEYGVKDLEAFKKSILGKEQKTLPPTDMNRLIIVIDEAFEMFMSGGKMKSAQVEMARTAAHKIAAQGRAVGVHLVIATQRPDRFAVDPQIKANLTGKLCFRLPNLASSMTVLDTGRAKDLPNIKGRAVWQESMDELEIQTPLLTEEDAKTLLDEVRNLKSDTLENEDTKNQAQQNLILEDVFK